MRKREKKRLETLTPGTCTVKLFKALFLLPSKLVCSITQVERVTNGLAYFAKELITGVKSLKKLGGIGTQGQAYNVYTARAFCHLVS